MFQLITASFQITDACGNANPDLFVCQYLIIDNTAPVWITQEGLAYQLGIDANVSCSDVDAYNFANSLLPVAADNCPGDVTVVRTQGVFTPGMECPSEGTVTNTFVAYDACGQNNPSVVFTQVISIFDNLPPTFDPMCQLDATLYTEEGADCPQDAGITLEGDILNNTDTWFVAGIEIPAFGSCVEDNCADASLIKIHCNFDRRCIRHRRLFPRHHRLLRIGGCLRQYPGRTLCLCLPYYRQHGSTAVTVHNSVRWVVPSLPQSCYANVAEAEADALAYFDEPYYLCDNCTPRAELQLSVATTGTCHASVKVTLTDCSGNIDTFTFQTRIDNEAPVMQAGTIASCYPSKGWLWQRLTMQRSFLTIVIPLARLTLLVTADGECPATITVTATDNCGNANSVVYPDILYRCWQ